MSESAWKKIGQGSSKDLYAHKEYPEHVFFEFSDRVSVFDYGALPDTIPGKGAALRSTAEFFFHLFTCMGVATAYDVDVSQQTGRVAMRAVRHPKFFPELKSSLEFIPLEVIFRWGVPAGSSLLKRRPELVPFARFPKALIEFSTKLESTDRLLTREEAQQIASTSLSARFDLAKLEAFAEKVAHGLERHFRSVGLELWDGKIECAYDAQSDEILLVDALTPDELRVTLPKFESIPLSKELLRGWIGRTDWAFHVRQAKQKNNERSDEARMDWKHALPPPPRLGAWRLAKLTGLYESFAKSMSKSSAEPLRDWLNNETRAPHVALIGNGGREAALRWKLESEGAVIVNDFAQADVIWVSPDGELAEGLVDQLTNQGHWTYGPVQAAAKVEWSKAFGREIAIAAGVTVPHHVEYDAQRPADLRSFAKPPVIKLDGLAAGKGVIVPDSWASAEEALATLSAKGKVLLEEQLSGFEASAFFALESGYGGPQVSFLGTAKDFKRRYPGDEGPNTGGMGAYAPHPQVTSEDIALFTTWAVQTARELEKRGLPYNGVLYLGLMKDPTKGWNLIEYNARLGDPETEALVLNWPENFLRALLSLDLVDFPSRIAAWNRVPSGESVLCLALVHPDYPEPVSQGLALPEWTLDRPNLKLFRTASTKGRVAYLVSRGPSLQGAGDEIFETLLDSPWKDLLEWRPDILK